MIMIFITGSMFTGKTTWLVNHMNKYHKKDGIFLRPSIDTRELITHNGLKYKAKSFENLSQLGQVFDDKIKAVYIDEVQFMPNVLGYDVALEQIKLISNIKPLFLAGLDYDFRKQIFPFSEEIIKICDEVKVLKTYCHICGRLAECYSYKKNDNLELIEIGGSDLYEPRCFNC